MDLVGVISTACLQEEVALAEKRQELFTLFRNAAKVAPAEAGSFVAERLERVLAGASASVQDVEVEALHVDHPRSLSGVAIHEQTQPVFEA